MTAVFWQPGVTLEGMEKQCILAAFQFYRGNKSQTALSLGITVRTLENKLKEYEEAGKVQEERDKADEIRRQELLNRMRGITPRVEETTAGAGDARKTSDSSNKGVRAQSSSDSSAQHEVSVPQRPEVQGVLSKQASAGSKQHRR